MDRPKGLVVGAMAFLAMYGPPPTSSQTAQSGIDCSEGRRSRWGQRDLNVCAQREAGAAQEKLRRLAAELDVKLAPPVRQALQQIQAQWTTLVEQDCDWEQGFFEGGSMAPMVRSQCVTALTLARIDRLKGFLCDGATATAPCEASRKYDLATSRRR